MVRLVDGLFGGLIAGMASALFYAVVTLAWLHDVSPSEFFALPAQALPPFHGAAAGWPLAVLGAVLYLLLAAVLGLVYSVPARRLRSMWQAPTSVAWGIVYGLLVWGLVNDVLVPLSQVTAMLPLWAGLVGTVIFYGVVLSELTTLAHRREASAAP